MMDYFSSFHGFVELIASPGELSFGDQFGVKSVLKLMFKLVLLYGSQPRPPEIRYALFLRCHITGLVCLRYQNSLFKHIDSGHLLVDADVAIWRSLESRCVSREMKIMLDSYQQILEFGMDEGWLVMLQEPPVITFRTYVQLVSRECNKDCMFLIYDLSKFTKFRFVV